MADPSGPTSGSSSSAHQVRSNGRCEPAVTTSGSSYYIRGGRTQADVQVVGGMVVDFGRPGDPQWPGVAQQQQRGPGRGEYSHWGSSPSPAQQRPLPVDASWAHPLQAQPAGPPGGSWAPIPQGPAAPRWVTEEVRRKASGLEEAISTKLVPRQQALLWQRGRISERCEEVKAATLRAVERVQSEAEEEAERLVALEAERLAALQADEDAVDTDLEELRGLASSAASEAAAALGGQGLQQQPGEALQRLESLEKAIDDACRKELKVELSATAHGIEQSRGQLNSDLEERHRSLAKLLAAKDHMIWKLLEDRARLQARVDALESYGGKPEAGPPQPCSADHAGRAHHRSDSVWVEASHPGSGSHPPEVPPRVSSDSE